MLWWSEGRARVQTSAFCAWGVSVLFVACGGTSHNDGDGASGGHAGAATAGAGNAGAAAHAGAGGTGVGGSLGSGGSSGMHGGSAGAESGGGKGAQGGSGGGAGRATAGRGGAEEAGAAGMGMDTGGKAGGGASGQGGRGGNAGQHSAGAGGHAMAGHAGMGTFADVAPAVNAYCGAIANCCGSAVSLDTCQSSYQTQSANYASLVAGLVTIDPDVLVKCQAAYAGADPCNLNAVVAACHGLFIGTRAVDDACTQGYDCDRSQGEMTCVIAGDCNVNPMGVCTSVPHAKAGDKCVFTCETGEDCSSTTCGVGDTNALCFEDDGLYCEYFDSGAICKAITPLGMPCATSGSPECGSEAYCDVTCKPLSKLGEPCGYGCRHELQCGPDSKCMDPVWNDEYSCTGYAPGL